MTSPKFKDALFATVIEMIKGSGGGILWATVLIAIGYFSGWPEGYEVGVFLVVFLIVTAIIFAAILRAKLREQKGYR